MRALVFAFFLTLYGGGGVAQSAREPTLGFTVQPFVARHQQVMIRRMVESGVRHIRTPWHFWSHADRYSDQGWAWYPAVRAAGIEVLPVIFANPHLRDDREIAASYVARYRDFVAAFGAPRYVQIGNEPDGDGLYGIPGRDPYRQGRRWGAVMKSAIRGIRALTPGVKVVSSGVAWNRPGVEHWVRGMVEGAGDGLDVLAIHIYGEALYRTQWGHPWGDRVPHVRAAGWTGPIWVTEMGMEDQIARNLKRDPDEYQSENLRRVLFEEEARHLYERVYWFQLTPDPHGWGILRPDFSPRPAYQRFRQGRKP